MSEEPVDRIKDQAPGEGWGDGVPCTWSQLRMFVGGGLFVLGLFTLVFALLQAMQVGGVRFRELTGDPMDLEPMSGRDGAWLEALRAALATLEWQHVAVFGLVIGPMVVACRGRLSAMLMALVIAVSYGHGTATQVAAMGGFADALGDPAELVRLLLLGLIAVTCAGAFLLMFFPSFWERSR